MALTGATNVMSRAWPWCRCRLHFVARTFVSPRLSWHADANPSRDASDQPNAKNSDTEHSTVVSRSVCMSAGRIGAAIVEAIEREKKAIADAA